MTCGTCLAVAFFIIKLFLKLSLLALLGTIFLLKLIWKTCCCACIVVPIVSALRYVGKFIFEIILIVVGTICETCGCAKLGGSHIIDAMQDCACCAVLAQFFEIFITFVISVTFVVFEALKHSINSAIVYLDSDAAQERAAEVVP